MYAVVKNGKYNGVIYQEITRAIVLHHTQYDNEYLAKVSKTPVEEANGYPAPTNDELMGFVRDYRNILLSETDWTQTLDSPLSDDKKTEFAAYRKTLRDIPQTHPDPNGLSWPDIPTVEEDSKC
ncbi:tail fiber assembly protein [Vibrio fortis]|uniref:tail fiber assembly protein n=1 Tax=Vibrio fortis TaxID=212667 RepID=UPI0038CD7FBC